MANFKQIEGMDWEMKKEVIVSKEQLAKCQMPLSFERTFPTIKEDSDMRKKNIFHKLLRGQVL